MGGNQVGALAVVAQVEHLHSGTGKRAGVTGIGDQQTVVVGGSYKDGDLAAEYRIKAVEHGVAAGCVEQVRGDFVAISQQGVEGNLLCQVGPPVANG